MTLGELIECVKTDDNGKPFDLTKEVVFATGFGSELLYLLSVYNVKSGKICIDIGGVGD